MQGSHWQHRILHKNIRQQRIQGIPGTQRMRRSNQERMH